MAYGDDISKTMTAEQIESALCVANGNKKIILESIDDHQLSLSLTRETNGLKKFSLAYLDHGIKTTMDIGYFPMWTHEDALNIMHKVKASLRHSHAPKMPHVAKTLFGCAKTWFDRNAGNLVNKYGYAQYCTLWEQFLATFPQPIQAKRLHHLYASTVYHYLGMECERMPADDALRLLEIVGKIVKYCNLATIGHGFPKNRFFDAFVDYYYYAYTGHEKLDPKCYSQVVDHLATVTAPDTTVAACLLWIFSLQTCQTILTIGDGALSMDGEAIVWDVVNHKNAQEDATFKRLLLVPDDVSKSILKLLNQNLEKLIGLGKQGITHKSMLLCLDSHLRQLCPDGSISALKFLASLYFTMSHQPKIWLQSTNIMSLILQMQKMRKLTDLHLFTRLAIEIEYLYYKLNPKANAIRRNVTPKWEADHMKRLQKMRGEADARLNEYLAGLARSNGQV